MNPPAIEITNLTKGFLPELRYRQIITLRLKREPKPVLKGIDLIVPRATVMGLFGPNGAGKTTLLKIMGTLLIPDTGEVRIAGRPLEAAKGLVNYVVHEERSFYWRLSVLENLRFFAALSGLFGRVALARIEHLLEQLQLAGEKNSPVKILSSGMRQRLAICRALLLDPQVMLFDEATKSLDLSSAENVRRFIRRELVEAQGRTVIYSTHQLDEIRNFCDFTAVLSEGRIVARGDYLQIKPRLQEVFGIS